MKNEDFAQKIEEYFKNRTMEGIVPTIYLRQLGERTGMYDGTNVPPPIDFQNLDYDIHQNVRRSLCIYSIQHKTEL